jgi:hypothetical protein
MRSLSEVRRNRVNIKILDILGVNDKVREIERAGKQAMIVGINIEILDILGVNYKVREIERSEKQAMVVGINIEILDIL